MRRVKSSASVAAAVASIVGTFGMTQPATANPGDQYILPIDHFQQGNGFVDEGPTGYNGSEAYSHAYTGPGDISRVYWRFNNAGVPADARLYFVEWWDATPSSTDGWQPIESQFNGDAGENYPIEPQIPWSGEYGTNHQWVAAESTAIGGGTWRLAGAGPHTPDSYSYNAVGDDGFYMWLKAGSELYAKWDFGFAIADGNPRTWSALRLTEVTPTPITLYWDINQNTSGAGGGSTPSGNWNGTSPNFNTNSTGAGSPTNIYAVTNPVDTVIFAAGTNATGAYTVNVSGTRFASLVSFTQGTVTLSGGNLAVGAFSMPAGVNATVTSVVSGLGSGVLKSGDGTLTFASANTFTGGMSVTGGNLVLANADALAGGAVSIDSGAKVQAQASLPKAVTVTTVTANGTGQFDLTNNSMVIRGMTAAQVQAAIASGFNGGSWNGAGINSSTAAADTNGLTAIGYASNADYGAASFKGVNGLTASDVLVRYTYYGDANRRRHSHAHEQLGCRAHRLDRVDSQLAQHVVIALAGQRQGERAFHLAAELQRLPIDSVRADVAIFPPVSVAAQSLFEEIMFDSRLGRRPTGAALPETLVRTHDTPSARATGCARKSARQSRGEIN